MQEGIGDGRDVGTKAVESAASINGLKTSPCQRMARIGVGPEVPRDRAPAVRERIPLTALEAVLLLSWSSLSP